jgi:hypothetical protein
MTRGPQHLLPWTPTDVNGNEARRELDGRDASHVQIPALSVLSPTI